MPDSPAVQDFYPDDAAHCYGCGRLNETGLRLRTKWDGDETVAHFTGRPIEPGTLQRYKLLGGSAEDWRLTQAIVADAGIQVSAGRVADEFQRRYRGENWDGIILDDAPLVQLRTLERLGLIEEVGRAPGAGSPILYGTTPLFLERLGINSLDELPPLAEHVPPAEVVDALERPFRPEEPSSDSRS